ncbi:hypothetical protein RUND412_005958 [Rhizina undulata]
MQGTVADGVPEDKVVKEKYSSTSEGENTSSAPKPHPGSFSSASIARTLMRRDASRSPSPTIIADYECVLTRYTPDFQNAINSIDDKGIIRRVDEDQESIAVSFYSAHELTVMSAGLPELERKTKYSSMDEYEIASSDLKQL